MGTLLYSKNNNNKTAQHSTRESASVRRLHTTKIRTTTTTTKTTTKTTKTKTTMGGSVSRFIVVPFDKKTASDAATAAAAEVLGAIEDDDNDNDDDDHYDTTIIKGKCFCGAVSFELTGNPVMNTLCHCNACTVAVGATCPIHLYLIPHDNYKINAGNDDGNGDDDGDSSKIKVYDSYGTLKIARCIECNCPIWKGPEQAPWKAFFPRYFEGYVHGKDNTLPKSLIPTTHINYENRGMDYYDDIPKFAAFPPDNQMNNDGSTPYTPPKKKIDAMQLVQYGMPAILAVLVVYVSTHRK